MPEDEAWAERAPRKNLNRSFSAVFSRHPSASEEYVFIVHTRDRRLKLGADNREQASAWDGALNAAHLMGKGITNRHTGNTWDRRPHPLSPASTKSTKSACSSTTASGASTTVSSSDGEAEVAASIDQKLPQ